MKLINEMIILPRCFILAAYIGSEHTSVSRKGKYSVCTLPGILRNLVYSEPFLFRHIQPYSIIIVFIILTSFSLL